MKILIIQTAFLGDVILATALAENLHKQVEGAKISMLVREGNENLLANHPFLNDVIVWKKKNGKFKSLFSVIGKVRSEKYDAVINLQRFFSTGMITALSGAAIKSGFDKNPWSFAFTHTAKHEIGNGKHEVDRNLQLTASICKSINRKPVLYPSVSDFETTARLKQKPYVVLAPATVWPTKQLPENKWSQLVTKLAVSHNVFLVGSPADIDVCESVIKNSNAAGVVNLSGKLSLLQTAALMKDAVMNYVNDSGPLHIASAMNAHVTAFFCSTVPAFGFGPLSDHSVIIETKMELSCRPCGLHGKKVCPLGHFNCGNTIEIP